MNTATWPYLALPGLLAGIAARHVVRRLVFEYRTHSPSPPTLVPELLSVAGFVLAGWIGGGGFRVAAICWLVTFALPAVLVDATAQRLPDILTWPCLTGVVALSLAQAAATGSLATGVRTVIAGIAVAGAFLLLALLADVGIGDVKLAASLGVVLGYVSWHAVAAGIAAGFCIAGLQATAMLLVQQRGVSARVPLGPALLAGGFLALVLTKR